MNKNHAPGFIHSLDAMIANTLEVTVSDYDSWKLSAETALQQELIDNDESPYPSDLENRLRLRYQDYLASHAE